MIFRESTQRLKVSCAVVAVGAISLILTGAVSAQEYTARLSVHWGPTHHSAIHAKMFADQVNKRADGRLRIDYFPSGQLFGVREQLGAVTSGAIEMGGIVGVCRFRRSTRILTWFRSPVCSTAMANSAHSFRTIQLARPFGMTLQKNQTLYC